MKDYETKEYYLRRAAPDLLRACKRVLQPVKGDDLEEIRNLVRSAIAKAEKG